MPFRPDVQPLPIMMEMSEKKSFQMSALTHIQFRSRRYLLPIIPCRLRQTSPIPRCKCFSIRTGSNACLPLGCILLPDVEWLQIGLHFVNTRPKGSDSESMMAKKSMKNIPKQHIKIKNKMTERRNKKNKQVCRRAKKTATAFASGAPRVYIW